MYRLSKLRHKQYFDRSKFKCSMMRCSEVWEMLPHDVQKATTKVKFKRLVKYIRKVFGRGQIRCEAIVTGYRYHCVIYLIILVPIIIKHWKNM